MPYVICSNDKYIRQEAKGYSFANDIDNASKWKKINSANNFVKNNLKGLCADVKYVVQENQVINVPTKPIELDYDILDKVTEILSVIKQMEKRRLYLIEQMQNIDLEIVDIEHAAEFYELNASQGYRLYKLLHDARAKRREFKNELEKINLFLGTSMQSANVENLEKSILGLNNKQYVPRINKELFNV